MPTIGREGFEEKLKKYGIGGKDFELVMMAYGFAKYGMHKDKRADGRRSFEHPKEMALIAMDELGIYDPDMIITLFLHDIKEDSFILSWWGIEFIFGEKVRQAVETLTKDRSLSKKERDEKYNNRLGASSKFVKMAKLIDRLHNIRDMNGWPPEKRKEYIEETEAVFLPIAKETSEYLYREINKICERYQWGR